MEEDRTRKIKRERERDYRMNRKEVRFNWQRVLDYSSRVEGPGNRSVATDHIACLFSQAVHTQEALTQGSSSCASITPLKPTGFPMIHGDSYLHPAPALY